MEIDKNRIEEIIERWESQVRNDTHLCVPKSVIKELKSLINPKWEPKGYEDGFYVAGYGTVGGHRRFTQNYILYGNTWPTKETAETARDMNKRNQLILQAKIEKGYGNGDNVICLNKRGVWQGAFSDSKENPELTFESAEQAEEVIKMVGLNES